jgi:HTH-type transcriptional regulator, competence development regulator
MNSSAPSSPISFGEWIRGRREALGELLRTVAAAADMDPSHLGKVERGERLPTRDQTERLARILKVDLEDLRARFAVAQLRRDWEDHPETVLRAAWMVQEEAAAYFVNKSVSNRSRTGK